MRTESMERDGQKRLDIEQHRIHFEQKNRMSVSLKKIESEPHILLMNPKPKQEHFVHSSIRQRPTAINEWLKGEGPKQAGQRTKGVDAWIGSFGRTRLFWSLLVATSVVPTESHLYIYITYIVLASAAFSKNCVSTSAQKFLREL